MMNIRITEPKKRLKPAKKRKKKKEKRILPTLTQQITGIKRKTPVRRITGFEIARI